MVLFNNVALLITSATIIFLVLLISIKLYFSYDLQSKWYFLALIAGLPLSYIINQLKIPVLNGLFREKVLMHQLSLLDGSIWVLIVGITEEGIKILVFLLLLLISKENKTNKESVGIAWSTGIGFGLGEILYLGSLLISIPTGLEDIFPWFIGFGVERFFVTFAHAFFLLIPLYGIKKGSVDFLLLWTLSVFVHALYDFSIIGYQVGYLNIIDLQVIVVLELILGFVGAFFILNNLINSMLNQTSLRERNELLIRAAQAKKQR